MAIPAPASRNEKAPQSILKKNANAAKDKKVKLNMDLEGLTYAEEEGS